MNKLTSCEIAMVFALYPMATTFIYDYHYYDPKNPEPIPVQDEVQGATFYQDAKIWCEHTMYEPKEVKLSLKPLHHLTNENILMACNFYDNTGFIGAIGKTINVIPKKNEPMIRQVLFGREWPFQYNLDLTTGAITLFREGRPFNSSHKQLMMAQWYCHRRYAIPLYFEDDHWANGKTALQLGIAIPDREPLNKLLDQKFKGEKDEIETWYFDKRLHNVDLDKVEVMDQVILELIEELKYV